MKKLIMIALMLLPVLSWAQSTNYNLTVKLNALKVNSKAYLVYQFGWTNQRVLDSAEAKNGVFLFKGTAADPIKTQLVIDHAGQGLKSLGWNPDMLVVYIENGNIMITGNDSIAKATVTGSKLNAEYVTYLKALSLSQKAMEVINAEFKNTPEATRKDKSYIASIQDKFKKAGKLRDSLKYEYIKKNPDSYFSLEALVEIAGKDFDPSKMGPIFKSLSARLQNSKAGVDFTKLLDAEKLGAIAPDFTQNDENGKPVKLSDFRGKYVLIDFWASWCGPCRAENPNVVKAYNKYHDKGFEILAVSLDNNKEAWLKAINDDKLTWKHVSDLKGWKNEVAVMFDVKAVPQNILIDPTGKIIAKKLRGEALEEKLGEIFK